MVSVIRVVYNYILERACVQLILIVKCAMTIFKGNRNSIFSSPRMQLLAI